VVLKALYKMSQLINRREFLKLAGAYSLGAFAPKFLMKPGENTGESGQKNILIIVFDALSAYHMSLHGYKRDTMPNLSRLADRAIVYHNNYSGSNFTTPGTASLLTGTLPWTHRATEHNDIVNDAFIEKNIFSEFNHYHRMVYSHNILANTLLKQLLTNVDSYIEREELFIDSDDMINRLFTNDQDISNVGWIRSIKQKDDGYSYSLFFSNIYQYLKKRKIRDIGGDFPRGLPFVNEDNYYVLEDAIDYLGTRLTNSPQPFLAYFHFLPPHYPYKTRKEFFERFQGDSYQHLIKPKHIFSHKNSREDLNKWHDWYDEFILYADAEFARLYQYLEQTGILENTWVILTSDHGDLFERGGVGHITPMMFEPVIKVPLLVFEPGRKSRLDIYDKTSGIDLLPTLLQVTGMEIPEWIEGEVLPPFAEKLSNRERDIFSLRAVGSDKDQPIEKATVTLTRGDYKLIYYFTYPELKQSGDLVELFHIRHDPNELTSLHLSHQDISDEMLSVIKEKLSEANQPYS